MPLGAQSTFVFVGAIALYIVVAVILLARGRIATAGAALLLVAVIPLTWQRFFTDSDAPGFVFLLPIMLPLPVGLLIVGSIANLWRVAVFFCRRLRERSG